MWPMPAKQLFLKDYKFRYNEAFVYSLQVFPANFIK